MKNNVIKRFSLLIIIMVCIFSLILPQNSYATGIGDIFTGADNFIQHGQSPSGGSTVPSGESTSQMLDVIYNTLLILGIVVAVIMGAVLGIKFMVGSVEERAKVKESLIAYIVGCVVIFGAFTIWKIVMTIIQSSPIS